MKTPTLLGGSVDTKFVDYQQVPRAAHDHQLLEYYHSFLSLFATYSSSHARILNFAHTVYSSLYTLHNFTCIVPCFPAVLLDICLCLTYHRKGRSLIPGELSNDVTISGLHNKPHGIASPIACRSCHDRYPSLDDGVEHLVTSILVALCAAYRICEACSICGCTLFTKSGDLLIRGVLLCMLNELAKLAPSLVYNEFMTLTLHAKSAQSFADRVKKGNC